eukprot:3795682-Prymnesium_polylepis.1
MASGPRGAQAQDTRAASGHRPHAAFWLVTRLAWLALVRRVEQRLAAEPLQVGARLAAQGATRGLYHVAAQ